MTDTDRTVRNIVLPVEVYEGLTQWHDSMWDPIYALHSTGRNNLVSLEMIDAAYDSLEHHVRRSTGAVKKQGLELLGELDGVRTFWQEHSAKAYGIEGHAAEEWVVHEGRPSWHQARAGHVSAASTGGFASKEEAEAWLARARENNPASYRDAWVAKARR